MQIYLAEITAAIDAIGTTATLRYGTDGYLTRPADAPPNAYYEPRITQPATMRRDMFSEGRTSGVSRVGYGELVLTNADGGLDALIGYGFDGREIRILVGEHDAAYPDGFTVFLKGTMEQPEFSWGEVTIRLRDRQAELDQPVQTTKYAGNNALPAGLEGVADDLKGRPKPRLYGVVYNFSPPAVNTSRLIFQVNDGPINTVSAVYDRGVALAKGADYADQADMEANAPAAANFRVWPAGGFFRLGSNPAGQITCDATQGATAADRTVAQLVQAIVTGPGGIAGADVSGADIAALDAANAAEVGVWSGVDERTCNELIDELCAAGAWQGFDRFGIFRLQRLEAPAGDPVATFTEVQIVSAIERVATDDAGRGVPAYRVNLEYARNYTVQDSDLAGAVTNARREWLKLAYRRVTSTDASIQDKHLLAPELTFTTPYVLESDAQTESDRRLDLYKERRDRLKLRTKVDAALVAAIDLGKVVRIELARFGYGAGKLFRVIGLEPDLRANAINLTVWG